MISAYGGNQHPYTRDLTEYTQLFFHMVYTLRDVLDKSTFWNIYKYIVLLRVMTLWGQ
jgi:hypothetical protein